MDFKNFFKNKFQIVGLSLLVIAIVSAVLTKVHGAFLYVSCISAAICCGVESAYFFVSAKKQKNSNELDLLPLTPEQRAQFEKQKKYARVNTIVKAVMLLLAGIVFIAVLI